MSDPLAELLAAATSAWFADPVGRSCAAFQAGHVRAHIATVLVAEEAEWVEAADIGMRHPTDGRPASARDRLEVAGEVLASLRASLLGEQPLRSPRSDQESVEQR